VLRLLADQNFDERILRGVRKDLPDIDLVLVRHVGLKDAADPVILAWAAEDARLLLTHDVTTMSHFAYARVADGLPMPGVFLVSDRMPIGQAIDKIAALAGASDEGEWEGQVRHLPLR